MSKILFSPIGTTDPISNMRDGSLLHICREYQPDIVYLYMSGEILKCQEKDQRYTYCLGKLEEKLGRTFEMEIIRRPDLVDVHKLDYFYPDFSSILEKISKSGDHEIFLNVSSGTPAMKMTLEVLAILSEGRYIPIQVSTPEKSYNQYRENMKKYDPEEQWELNMDNDPAEYDNRCSIVKGNNLHAMIQIENVKKLLMSYDYAAALEIAKSISESVGKEAMDLLLAAYHRNMLNTGEVTKYLGDREKDYIPVRSADQRILVEYLLTLQNRLKAHQYADFIRAITPVFMDLLEYYLKFRYKMSLEVFCRREKRGKTVVWIISRKVMERKCPDILKKLDQCYSRKKEGKFQDRVVSSDQLAQIIEYLSDDEEMVRLVREVRGVEKEGRNLPAHEIISVTDEWIKANTGFSARQILDKLGRIIVKNGIKFERAYWNSYDVMNEKIIQLMEDEIRKGTFD